jgi:hypothetical protein
VRGDGGGGGGEAARGVEGGAGRAQPAPLRHLLRPRARHRRRRRQPVRATGKFITRATGRVVGEKNTLLETESILRFAVPTCDALGHYPAPHASSTPLSLSLSLTRPP